MRIFVTGANGFIGSALIPELIKGGHQVLGLTRSEEGARALGEAGAAAWRGDVNDVDGLRKAIEHSEGVIHTAFNHDFSRFMASCEEDRKVITAMGDALAGSNRPMVVTSSIGSSNTVPGTLPVEDNPTASSKVFPRAASDEAALALADRGINVSIMRNPQIHNTVKQGLVSDLVKLARQKGRAAYVGDGSNRWSATHISDAVQLYRLAIEKAQIGAKYHAVAEEGIAMREIAEVIAEGLHLPAVSISEDDAPEHFGWLIKFAGRELTASGQLTQERLNWTPKGPGLIADLQHMKY
jgi:nucleoside-diphosphate-sugar epimerase